MTEPKLLCAFTVPGEPVPKGSMRAILPKGGKRPVAIPSNAAKQTRWTETIRHYARAAIDSIPGHSQEGPFAVRILFYVRAPKSLPRNRDVWPTRRPDADKLCRCLLDGLTGTVWRDDSQVVRCIVEKRYAGRQQDIDGPAGEPRAVIHVSRIGREAEA